MVPCSLFPIIAKSHYTQYHKWKRHISHFYLNCQIPPGFPVELVLPRSLLFELSYFCCHGYSFLLLSYLCKIRTLPAAPVDNIYRISTISFLTVLPQSLHSNLSLALVYGFYFRSLVQTLRFGPTVGTLQSSSVPPSTISQERVCSTPTFNYPQLRTTGLEAVTKLQNKELFVTSI